jgi:hypothetical protein
VIPFEIELDVVSSIGELRNSFSTLSRKLRDLKECDCLETLNGMDVWKSDSQLEIEFYLEFGITTRRILSIDLWIDTGVWKSRVSLGKCEKQGTIPIWNHDAEDGLVRCRLQKLNSNVESAIASLTPETCDAFELFLSGDWAVDVDDLRAMNQ